MAEYLTRIEDLATNQVLKEAMDSGILNIDGVREQIEMKRREEILKAHKYKIWQGKDGLWYTHVYDEQKKNNRRKIKRKTEEQLKKVLIQHYRKQEKKGLDLADIYPEWLEYFSLHTRRSSTVKRYTSEWERYYVGSDIAKIPLTKLDTMTLDVWAHKMIKEHNMSYKQYNTMVYIMRHSLEYAREKGYISENPFVGVKIAPKMFRKEKKKADATQVYREDEKALIIEEAIEDYKRNPKYIAPLAVILMFCLGTRPGEVVALKESDREGEDIHVQRMEVGIFEKQENGKYVRVGREVVEHTKSDAGDRNIPLIENAKAILDIAEEFNRKQGYTGGYLFVIDGERIHESAVEWRLKKYCKHLGIPYRSLHKIRKTVISAMIDAKININTIRRIAGHEDERTTYKNYCFDRAGSAEIRNRMELALGCETEKSNIIWFENLKGNHQVPKSDQVQAV